MARSSERFEQLYADHAEAVYRYLHTIGSHPDDRDDAFQQAWINVHRALGSYDERGSVVPWLLTIARNALRDVQRQRGRIQAPLQSINASEHDVEQRFSDPMHNLVGDELAAGMAQAVAELSPKLREVYCLRMEQQLSYEDIAEITGEPKARLTSRFHLAIKELRAQWHKHTAQAEVQS